MVVGLQSYLYLLLQTGLTMSTSILNELAPMDLQTDVQVIDTQSMDKLVTAGQHLITTPIDPDINLHHKSPNPKQLATWATQTPDFELTQLPQPTRQLPYEIFHLAKYYPPVPGGIETHVQTLARAQAALGAKVHVICINGTTKSIHGMTATDTIDEMDGDVKVTRMGRALTFARFDVCPQLPQYLAKTVKGKNALVHLHTPNPSMLMAMQGWNPEAPLVITHHSDIIKQRVLKYALRPFEHQVYRQASKILTTNAQYIEGSKFLQLYGKKVDFLPLGLDINPYTRPNQASREFAVQLRQKYGSTPIWLAVGRLVYYKALHVAIQALTYVPGILYVIGAGPLEGELKELAAKLGVSDRVVWHGQATADELAGAYQAANAHWFPSNARSEAFGLVQIEAMASGCPVINADIPCSGVTWVSRHEKEGLTVPINDPAALALAARRILNEQGLRERLAYASRQRAEDFRDLNMARRSFNVYEQLLHPQTKATSSAQLQPAIA
jgi:glycosyltransferase involved in cell wall biosynthesis